MEKIIMFMCIILLLCNSALAGKKIIGGVNTTIEQYPFIASLQFSRESGNTEHDCGAAILSNLTLVTAAHCVVYSETVQPVQPSFLKLRVGTSLHDSGGIHIPVKAVHVHEKFHYACSVIRDRVQRCSVDYDVATLTLATPLTFTSSIQSINFKEVVRPVPGESVVAVGWGYIDNHKTQVDQLQVSNSTMVAQIPCGQKMREAGLRVTARMLCAGTSPGNGHVCYGDSGGPLMDPTTESLVGLTSWINPPCANPGYPDVYTDLTNPEINAFVLERVLLDQGGE